jgi:hypothetical protein
MIEDEIERLLALLDDMGDPDLEPSLGAAEHHDDAPCHVLAWSISGDDREIDVADGGELDEVAP